MSEKDYADRQVVGLDRYIPTTRSRILLAALPLTPSVVLVAALSISDFQKLANLLGEKWLLALLSATVVAFLISFLLVLELAFVVNHDKHYPVFHLTNKNPLMSFTWLYKNASSKHWIFIASLCALFFYAGFYVANL